MIRIAYRDGKMICVRNTNEVKIYINYDNERVWEFDDMEGTTYIVKPENITGIREISIEEINNANN